VIASWWQAFFEGVDSFGPSNQGRVKRGGIVNKLTGLLAGLITSAFFVAGVVATPAIAQEKMTKKTEKAAAVKKGTIKPIVDNEKMKAWEVTYKPGEGSEMSERAPRLVHALSGGTMRRTMPDGKTNDLVWKAGDTRWLPKENFANRNAGKTVVRLLVVQPK